VDFSWTAEQQELFQSARTFARERLGNRGNGAAAGVRQFDRDRWEACGEFGLLGLCVPKEYGGLGLDLLTTARVVEGFGEGCDDLGLLFSASAHLFACCVPIAHSGSEELKQGLLPRLASGELIGANAITEPEAGSDLQAVATRATREGDLYRLDGSKIYVTNGPVADLAVVYARTDARGGYLSLSAFAVDTALDGVVVGEPFQKTGLASSPLGSLYLNDCAVPVHNLIGAEGQGSPIFKASMTTERACLFAAYLGAMQRQLDTTVEFAHTRRQFGRPIGKNQAISHKIADMKLRLEQARLLLYRACWLVDRGEDAMLAVSMAKLAVSEAAVRSGLDAMQIHGGLGVIAETGIEEGLRDALPATIFSGTSEIQREIVAVRLGL
jgi:alkylation response protein AidB-like acyl-CoA dehydrogenase